MKRAGTAVEVKVGLLVLAGIALLFYMSLRVSRLERIEGEVYYALFSSVSGLVEGAPVEVAGVTVGRVEKISLEDTKAKVTMVIGGVALYEDAEAILRTRGALGDKFIQVNPGTPTERRLSPGEVIKHTKSAPDLDQLFASLQRTAEGLAGMGEALKEVVGDREIRQALKELVLNFRDSSREFKTLLTENRQRIDRAVANFEDFSRDLRPLLSKASRTLDTLEGSLTSLQKVGKDLQQGKGTLGKLLTDDQLYRDLRGAIEDLRKLAQRVNKGEGTLGKLLTDEQLYRDLQEAIAEFRRIAERINQGEGTLGKLVTDDSLYRQAERTLKKVEKAAEGMEEQTPITVIGTAAGLVF
ncbi:MAG: mammalian cell entry protein [Deltaproteobacteria bacterium]|nr:MAG: mammalian cell entry protein [Deltaproteobacteria bacterium]